MSAPLQDRPASRHALVLMCAGAAIIGTNGLMVRALDMPPTASAFWRMLLAGLMLGAWVVLGSGWRRLPGPAWAWIAVPSVAFAADLWLWHRSILLVGPGLATLLANAQVFFMALAGMAFFGERPGRRFLAGLLFAFAGLWLLLGGGWSSLPADYRWGVWLGLGTGVCYALYNIGLRGAQARAHVGERAAPIGQVLALASLGAALLLGIAAMGEGTALAIPDARSLGILLVLAGVGHALSWVLISHAMPHLRVAVIGLLLLLQPVVAFVLDVWLFERATSPREWAGLALTLAGIFLAGSRARGPDSQPP